MNKELKTYLILCILQNVYTDEIMETAKDDTALHDNETFYKDYTLNQNTPNDWENYSDLNKNDTASTNDEISEINEFTNNTQLNDNIKEDDNILGCTFEKDVYIFNGQVVEALIPSSRPPIFSIHRCKPSFRVDAILNVSMTEHVVELYVRDIKWPPISETFIGYKAFLANVSPVGLWGGCSQMTTLDIESPNFTLTSPEWLAKCTRLRTMKLKRIQLSDLKFILDSVPKIEELQLRLIYEIDKIVYNPVFPSARGAHQWITTIDIDNFGIENYVVDNMVIESGIVTSADMSVSLLAQLSLLPLLKELRLSSLKYFDFCAAGNLTSVTLPSLQHLMLYLTDTRYMCLRELRTLPHLTYLYLVQNHLNALKFGELFSSSSPQLYVNLELARVQQFTFLREDYLALTARKQKGNVTLHKFQYDMECDCGRSLWLARALLDGLVTAPGLACRDGSALENQNCDWLNCERVPCNNACVCCVDEPGTVVGDCRDANITALPEDLLKWSNLTAMLIPYNNLTLLPDTLPANLKFLDLSGNDVFRMSGESEISALFAASERHVLLYGNAIICSCDTQLLIRILQDHKDQIEDYESLTCAGDNTKLSTVVVSALCTSQEKQKAVVLIVSLLLVAAVFSLLLSAGYYYRRSIQIFLYARGWCLFCVKEEKLDADRQYDVFLSFCYEDDAVVMQEILPVLDREYSVCVHYRDWGPGDMIPVQITRSVEQSRRTVVIVSRNFIKSLWGLLEFRTAHFSGLMEGRVRVVMVVLDDILDDENLESEVKAYVRLNTYVMWGDPWFWDKLRFALPHRPTPFQRNVNNERLAAFVNEQLPMIEMPPDEDLNHSSTHEV